MYKELRLERGDLLQVDTIANRGTLKLLPVGKKGKQKLVVGDDSGTLHCYEFKKGEPQVVFTMKAFEAPISNVCIGGAKMKQDKLFAASGQRVLGVTKKGKEFFKMTSSLTENINHIIVDENRLWTGCEFIYNMYEDGVDKEFYMCRDMINAMVIENITRDVDYDVVFGCQDSCLRIVHGSNLLLEIPTPSPVTALCSNRGAVPMRPGVSTGTTASSTGFIAQRLEFGAHLIYGMDSGAIGLTHVFFQGDKLTYSTMWVTEDWNRQRISAITCIDLCDLNNDKIGEIVVGRDDGRVEVYGQLPAGQEPQLLFTKEVNESIRAIDCGVVNTVGFVEVLVATFTGKILSFTTEAVVSVAADDRHGRTVQMVHDENRIKFLKNEVDQLRSKVDKEKERLKKMSTVVSDLVTSSVTDFPVNIKFLLDTEQGMYFLTMELQSTIDLILIRSPIALSFLEAEIGNTTTVIMNQKDEQASTVEATDCKYFSAIKCPENEKRLRIHVRPNEGDHGELEFTIVANNLSGTASNAKSAKIVGIALKPLSLHARMSHTNVSTEDKQRPRHRLRFQGQGLSLGMIVNWLQTIFPDIPPRLVNEAEDNAQTFSEELYYRNVFTQAIVIISIRNRELVFQSENASTISIIKENINRLATYHRINMEESLDLQDRVVESFLKLIQPKLEQQLRVAKQMQVIEAVQELLIMEGQNTSDVAGFNGSGNSGVIDAEAYPWLDQEYLYIAQNQQSIRDEFKQRERILQYLSGIITDLYVDFHKLKNGGGGGGVEFQKRLPELHQLIYAADMQSIINYFLFGFV